MSSEEQKELQWNCESIESCIHAACNGFYLFTSSIKYFYGDKNQLYYNQSWWMERVRDQMMWTIFAIRKLEFHFFEEGNWLNDLHGLREHEISEFHMPDFMKFFLNQIIKDKRPITIHFMTGKAKHRLGEPEDEPVGITKEIWDWLEKNLKNEVTNGEFIYDFVFDGIELEFKPKKCPKVPEKSLCSKLPSSKLE